ncbi:hypothetical protein LF844_13925 [Metapseudomonas lalkuanensis]|uniref:hypothetical protein n=1 Tax=Metapseudomonas lalkuanensis TaxID=2604832 RepID=UPI001CF0F5F5|nr:hypothetical protein [Pseudomonas lalkuanensis]UCP00848.1 hypothetical protein LF844_13925 [Pseudomonas lalkuanensis]
MSEPQIRRLACSIGNQQELQCRILAAFEKHSDRLVVTGLYSFCVEDMMRPYQRVLFVQQIDRIFFNEGTPYLKPRSTRHVARTRRFSQKTSATTQGTSYLEVSIRAEVVH